MTKVAAVKADSYDPHIVQQAIADLLAHIGGMSQFIQPGDRVLVKPNMLEAVEKEGHCGRINREADLIKENVLLYL